MTRNEATALVLGLTATDHYVVSKCDHDDIVVKSSSRRIIKTHYEIRIFLFIS